MASSLGAWLHTSGLRRLSEIWGGLGLGLGFRVGRV